MLRRWAPIACLALLAQPALAVDVTVTSAQVTRFKGVGLDEPVGKLIFRGGLTLQSQDDMFGGLFKRHHHRPRPEHRLRHRPRPVRLRQARL
ncbi:hypothetical protein [Devosia riboflavina]